MKKFLDKYLFSRSGAQLLASVGVILLFALLVPSCRRVATGAEYKGVFQFLGWGLKQVSSPAGAVGTLEGLDGVLNPASRVLMLLMAEFAHFPGLQTAQAQRPLGNALQAQDSQPRIAAHAPDLPVEPLMQRHGELRLPL